MSGSLRRNCLQTAEQTITADLEQTINKAVDPVKADYAVITGEPTANTFHGLPSFIVTRAPTDKCCDNLCYVADYSWSTRFRALLCNI